MLVDTNIIIYAARQSLAALRRFFADHAPAVSVVSYVEVLGYHRLQSEEETGFRRFFATTRVLPIDQAVVEVAVRLRQMRKLTLGDALVAGTAVAHGLTLVTHNVRDFAWVPDLKLLDPLENVEDKG
jgi:predicted nucleic acid-binding protein